MLVASRLSIPNQGGAFGAAPGMRSPAGPRAALSPTAFDYWTLSPKSSTPTTGGSECDNNYDARKIAGEGDKANDRVSTTNFA